MTAHYREAVERLFKASPGQWISAYQLMEVGGRMAWRTRVSDCRRELGMTIENRIVRHPVSKVKHSEYRYCPASLLEIAS